VQSSLYNQPRSKQLTSPARVLISEPVLSTTFELLASYGNGRHEGVVYWAGQVTDQAMLVLHAIAPDAETGSGFFRTGVEANAAAVSRACRLRLQLLAQVHSHPGRWVAHSAGDDRMAFKPYPGTYSIVVPSYGRGSREPTAWGIFWWDGRGFHELDEEDAKATVLVVPTASDLRTRPERIARSTKLERVVRVITRR
jgi:hypothetical protein